MSPPPVLALSRPEMLWVVEQCGGDAWPYPLRRHHWPAETERETALHRARAEQRLRDRGLLAPAPAALLLTLGELVRDWCVAVDVVRRGAADPVPPGGTVGSAAPAGTARAVVALSDGRRAVVLAASEQDGEPVHLAPTRPDRLPEAVLAAVGPGRPGTGPTVGVPADVLAAPAAGGTRGPADGSAPTTRRSAEARRHARRLVDTASGWALAGVAVRPPSGPGGAPGVPARREPLVMWLDGPHGRHRVVHDRRGGATRALVAPVADAELAADLHRLVGTPPPPGRRTP